MDLDLTLFIQLVLLAALIPVLERLLFAPMLRVIEARQQKIYGTRHEAERLERLAAADKEAYDTRVRQARRQAQARREGLRAEGRDASRRLVAEARARLATAMAATRAQVHDSERQARAGLQGDVEPLAQALVGRLLDAGSQP